MRVRANQSTREPWPLGRGRARSLARAVLPLSPLRASHPYMADRCYGNSGARSGRKQIVVRAKGGRRGRRGRVSGFKETQQRAVGLEPAEVVLCCNCWCLCVACSARQVDLAVSGARVCSHVAERARLTG